MKRSALVLLLLGSANTACFRPTLDCARCGLRDACPSGFRCNAGFCTTAGGLCGSELDGSDGSVEHPSIDGGDRLCISTSCIDLSPFRSGLVVWADRTSLPPGDEPVTNWLDRSGNDHPVQAFNASSPPLVKHDSVGRLADISDPQSILWLPYGSALNFGTSDFTIMVLARCDSAGLLDCVFDNTTFQRPRVGVKLYCNVTGSPYLANAMSPDRAVLQLTDTTIQEQQVGLVSAREDTPDALHLYVARKADDVLQLRMDGELQGQATVSSNFTQSAPLFVGSSTINPSEGNTTIFKGAIGAVIVIEGSLDDATVSGIEDFVLATMGPSAPPLL
jgi:hypothetical protein